MAEAFRAVVERYQGMVYSIALRITGDAGTAEEVAQDAFLALHRAAVKPVGEHLKFWLRRVAVQESLDALRRRARRPEAGAEEWMEESHSPGEMPAPGVLEGRIEELLATLPEAMRVAVTLRYGEEMRVDEIAALLEQPVASVKSNLQRGLGLLRKKAAVRLKEYVR